MTDVRCPQCTAHVATSAAWCGQCYTRLVKEPVKPARPPLRSGTALLVVSATQPTGAVALLGDSPPPPPPPPGSIPPPPAPPGQAPGKLRLGKPEWPCVHCETVNKYEDNTCSACGLGFMDALAEEPERLPLVGAIDTSSLGGKFKVGLLGFVSLVVVILVLFTIAGLILH